MDVGAVLKDLRFGARALGRHPGSAATAVVVLAIGIGLCSFMFSIIYGVYFRGMDVPEPDRLVVVHETLLEQDQTQRNVPIQNYHDWKERQSSFSELAAVRSGTVNVAGAEEPYRFQGSFVTANALPMVGVEPILGRVFASDEDSPGSLMHVVLGYDAWMTRYGGDQGIIGTDVRVNGELGTILGVMPEGFEWPNNTEVWVPMTDDPLASERGQGRYVMVWGRLADGVSMDRAGAEMANIAGQLEREFPAVNEGIGAAIYTSVEAFTDETLNLVFGTMMFAVICVLLVACANVASLLLARASVRTREAGIRVAIGGGRLRVMLPFLAEALVLSAIGALVGVGIAYFGAAWFDGVTDPARTGRPWFMQFAIDLPILGFVVALAIATALIAGIAPALQLSRTDVNVVLKDESRGSSSLRGGRLTKVLVTAEVALSVALLVGAGLMTKSMINLGNVQHPFETDGVFTARVGLFQSDYPDRDARQALWTDLARELEALPGVQEAALTSSLPYSGSGGANVMIEGEQYLDPGDYPQVHRVVVSPGYFEALGVDVVSGRDFTEADVFDQQLVAIVNQPMVERYFGGSDPLGKTFRVGTSDTLPVISVVGVVPDLQLPGADPPSFPGYEPAGFYLPLGQTDASFMSLLARTGGGEAMAVTADVRQMVRRLDPDLPIYDVFDQNEVIDRATWFYAVFGTVFVVFGLAALFMASAGLYGVLAFGVSRRVQEVGIRMALGADRRSVVGLVARQGAKQLGIGLGIGLALAFGVTRVIGILMYEVDPQDPMVFGAVVAVIGLVGIAAAVFPARRASGVSPVVALRSD